MDSDTALPFPAAGSYINIAKVAIAVAILQDKPENLSAEDHTKYLQLVCQQTHTKWKVQVQQLEDKVLSLTQKLVKADLAEELSDGHQCDADSQEDTVFPTPPCSSGESRNSESLQVAIKQHTNFLSSITRLKRITKSGETCEESLSSVIRDSIVCCIKHIRTFLTSGLTFPVPMKDVLHVFQLICTIAEMPSLKRVTADIAGEIMNIFEELLEAIITQDTVYSDNFYEKQTTSELLITMGKSTILCPGVMETLVIKLFDYSKKLRSAKFGENLIDPVEFENMFYVFKITEELLRHIHQELWSSSREKNNWLMNIDLHKYEDFIDDSLLHIAEDVPMFAQYVWRLRALLTEIKVKQ